MDNLANALINMKNCETVGKTQCTIKPASKLIGNVLKIMQKQKYIGEFEFIDDGKAGIYQVKLLGKINNCRAVKPRYSIKKEEVSKWEQRYLPSRNIGILIISTPQGVISQKALKTNNSVHLQSLSNKTVHSASVQQNTEHILMAVIIYSLSKLIHRKNSIQIKNWENFVKKINSIFDLSIKSLRDKNQDAFSQHLARAINTIKNVSGTLKPYIKEVLRKASINKASKIYEHGISLGQTAKLLGLSQWELATYIGQKNIPDIKYNTTLNIKNRAKMALDFFN